MSGGEAPAALGDAAATNGGDAAAANGGDAPAANGGGAAPGGADDKKRRRSSDGGDKASKRPREEKRREKKPKEAPYDPRKTTEPRKLIVPGPPGWHVELKPQLSPPTPLMGPCLLPLPLRDMLLECCKHERCSLDDIKHWGLHCEPDVGVKIDLIKGDTPPGDPTNVLPAEDEAILKSLEPLMGADDKGGDAFARGKKHAKSAVWLKNTVYLSNNLHAPVHEFGSRAKEQQKLAAETMNAKIEHVGGTGAKAVDASFAAAAALDGDLAALKHDKKPHLTAEFCVPLAPDLALWANSYVQVAVRDDPDFAVRGRTDEFGKPLPLGTQALVSKVCTTSHKRRGHNVLSASYSTPAPDDPAAFEWTRQYQLNFKEEGGAAGDRLALFVDADRGAATYVRQQPKRMELDKGRPTEAAREDSETPIDLKWSGKTTVTYEKGGAHGAPGFDAATRNAHRQKMRAIDNVDVSEDEEEEDDEEEEEEEEA